MAEQPQSEPATASASTSPPTPSEPLTHDGEPYPLKDVETPHPHDVLCGRGGGTNNHIGNNHWRTLVSANKRLYISLPKRQKMLVAQSIVRAVRSQNPPGRFLQKDTSSGMWCDIGDQKAQDKTSQALREGAPDIRQEMKDEQEIVRKIAVAAAGKPMMPQQGGQQPNGASPFSAGVPGVPPWSSMPPTPMGAPVSMNGMPGPHGPGPGGIPPPPPPPGPPPIGGSPMMGFPSPHSINSPMYANAPVLLPTPAQQQQQMQMHLIMQQQQMMQHNQGGHNHAQSPLNTRMPPPVTSQNLSLKQPPSRTGKAEDNAGKENDGGSHLDGASSNASGSSSNKLADTTSKADAAPDEAAVVSSPGLMPLAESEAASPSPEQLQKRDESAGGPSSTGVAPAGLGEGAGEDGIGIAPKATPSDDRADEPIGLPKMVNGVRSAPTPVAGIRGNSALDGIESAAPLPTPGTKRDRSRGLEQLQRQSLPPSWQQKTSATPPSALLQHQHPHPQHGVTFAPDMLSSNFFDSSPAKAPATTSESEDEAFNKLMRDQPAFEPTPFPMLNSIPNGAAARKSQPSLIDSDDEDDRVGNVALPPFGSAGTGRQRKSLVDTDSEDENEDSNSGKQSSEDAAKWETIKAMLESQGGPTPAPAAAAPLTALKTETSYGGMSEFSIDDMSLQSMSISRNASRTNPLMRTPSGGFAGGIDLCPETNFCRDHSLAFSDMSLSRGVSLSAREEDTVVAPSLPTAQGFHGGGIGVSQGVFQPPRPLTAEQQHLLGGVAPMQNLSQEQGEHMKQEPMPLSAQEANHDSVIEENGADGTAVDASGSKEERESLERLFLGRGASLAHETFGPDAAQML